MFGRRKKEDRWPDYPTENFEPVIRCSICTGEQVAYMRERQSGRLHELMLIRDAEDLAAFCRRTGANADAIRRIY